MLNDIIDEVNAICAKEGSERKFGDYQILFRPYIPAINNLQFAGIVTAWKPEGNSGFYTVAGGKEVFPFQRGSECCITGSPEVPDLLKGVGYFLKLRDEAMDRMEKFLLEIGVVG